MHWSKKAKAAKKSKQDAFYCTKEKKISPFPDGKITLKIVFFCPNNRRYDQDNAVASLKSGLDGIALALGVNDSRFAIKDVQMVYQPPGCVEVTLCQ